MKTKNTRPILENLRQVKREAEACLGSNGKFNYNLIPKPPRMSFVRRIGQFPDIISIVVFYALLALWQWKSA